MDHRPRKADEEKRSMTICHDPLTSQPRASPGHRYIRPVLRTCAAAAILLLLLYPSGCWRGLRYSGIAGHRGENHGKRGAVVSESALCSHRGADMIKLGGNAADAMIATSFCLGVVAMYHSGIAGGGFALVRDSSGQFEFLDYRETAPAASVDDFNRGAPLSQGSKSGIPGEIRGLAQLHHKYGSLPWPTLIMPSVKLARDGFPVTRDLAQYIQYALDEGGVDFFSRDASWAVDFAPDGAIVQVGDIITRKRYADTLESIARHGPDAFYAGKVASEMVEAVQAAGGVMTLDDLANYQVAIRNCSEIDYRGYRVVSGTAPSSGIVVLNILKVLNQYDPLFAKDNTNLSTHRLDEAIKFAYGLKTKLGDPDFVDEMGEYQDFMLRPSTIDSIRKRILDNATHPPSAYNPEGIESLATPGTSHIAAVDASGLAISATTTINRLFGNQLMVPENGIIMNNEMEDFSMPDSPQRFGYMPSPANLVQAGKRPLSAMSPTIVEYPDGSLFMVAGAAGGSFIPTATVQNIISAVDEGLASAPILAKPRLHDQLVPNHVFFENTYDNATVDFMRSLGHGVVFIPPFASMAHAIRVRPDGSWDAAAEPRQQDSGSVVV